jgi:hypothetical protein
MIQAKIEQAYKNVFPNSHISISTGILGSNSLYVKGFLCAKGEWHNGISQNDPLSYSFNIDENGTYEESTCSIIINPSSTYLFADSAKMRRKTIKSVTIEKLEKRFNELKLFILSNETDWHSQYKDVIASKVL